MIKIEVQGVYPSHTRNVEWPAVPRIGDSIDFDQDIDRGQEATFTGVVKSVVWWSDGTVRVVCR